MKRNYHQGDLRAALLTAAAEQITEGGVDSVSLRALARRCGVSHAAPAHHFGDRTGVFTALATEGFDLLTAELDRAGERLLDGGLAYVRFALAHPGHFDVMFRHDLLNAADPVLTTARTRAGERLGTAVAHGTADATDARPLRLAAWSVAHGFASLWREGAFGEPADTDAAERLAVSVLGTVRLTGVDADRETGADT